MLRSPRRIQSDELRMSRLSGKALKGQWIGSDHMTQRIYKQVSVLAAIEPELHVCQIRGEMLRTDFVPASDDAALQERECIFNCVGVDSSSKSDVLSRTVVYGFMFVSPNGLAVSRKLIGHDYVHIRTDVFLNVSLQRSSTRILGMEETHIAATLPDANHNFLALVHSPLAAASTALLSANIGFVHFYRAIKHRALFRFHGSANPVKQIPRCFVRAFVLTPKRAPQLISRHPFSRFHKQQYGEKPVTQGKVRVMEDRAAGNGELVFARGALIACIFFQPRDARVFAARTHHAFRPAQSFKQSSATFISRIKFIHIRESHDRTSQAEVAVRAHAHTEASFWNKTGLAPDAKRSGTAETG